MPSFVSDSVFHEDTDDEVEPFSTDSDEEEEEVEHCVDCEMLEMRRTQIGEGEWSKETLF